jgi:glutaconate CoA-transferase subunit B
LSFRPEELLACVVARLLAGVRHVAVGAASPIPASGVFLLRESDPGLRLSLLQKRAGNPFTEGSRELFDLAGQGRIDAFFLGGAQIDGQGNVNLVHAEGRRFPGSFGSAFMYQAVPKVILFREEHSRRVLVPKVEFVSARGTPPAGPRRSSPARRSSAGTAGLSWRASIPASRWTPSARRPGSRSRSRLRCAKRPALPTRISRCCGAASAGRSRPTTRILRKECGD